MAAAAIAAADGRSHERLVAGAVTIVRSTANPKDAGNVVVWLTPAGEPRGSADPAAPRARLKIAQRNKQFDPHLLVAEAGSVVDFPNFDPFFHNVFSMFDGKRFDLGLYEAGGSRHVSFTKPGVCYIFCNIHPEMSAIVVVIDTPYFAVTNAAGEFAIRDVPPGRYQLSLWHERFKPERADDVPREVVLTGAAQTIGAIRLVETNDIIVPHKNKYGHDYVPPKSSNPVYKGS